MMQDTVALPTLAPGGVLGDRYEVQQTLAVGGMGVVFRGYDRLLRRTVAIKTLHPYLGDTPAASRFAQEGRTLALLNHPNLVTMYDVQQQDGLPCLVMEYVEGESLADLIGRCGRVTLAAGLPLAIQVCEGLAYAHGRGVVHRDIKPENLVVTASGVVKIVDFGIARGPGSTELTEPGLVLGTAYYLAPEVAAGHEATPRSDLYALGVVLYRLFTGRLPFEGRDAVSVALRHRSEPVPRPSAIVAGFPPALEQLLLGLLEKEPVRRYHTAESVAAALRGIQQGLSAATGPGGVKTERLAPQPPEPPAWEAACRQLWALCGTPLVRWWRLSDRGALLRPGLGWAASHAYSLTPVMAALLVLVPALFWSATRPAPGSEAAISAVPAAVSTPDRLMALEASAGLMDEVSRRAANVRGNRGERLMRLTEELNTITAAGRSAEFPAKRAELESEMEYLVRQKHLLPIAADRVRAKLAALREIMEPAG